VLRFGDERVDVMAEVLLLAKDPAAGRTAVSRWIERLQALMGPDRRPIPAPPVL